MGPTSPTVPSEEEGPFDLEATLRGDYATAAAQGLKSEEIVVLRRNLTVRGRSVYAPTFPDACIALFNPWLVIKYLIPQRWRQRSKVQQDREVDTLHSFRGVVKPGEMVLVLGRPGSGCSTFLKMITNQRAGYTNVLGQVRYGLRDWKEFEKRFRGEGVYNAKDESTSMLPTLTVGQTVGFALDTKVPGQRIAGISRKECQKKVISLLLRMFDIEVSRNSTPFSLLRGATQGVFLVLNAKLAYRTYPTWRTLRSPCFRWREKSGCNCGNDDYKCIGVCMRQPDAWTRCINGIGLCSIDLYCQLYPPRQYLYSCIPSL